MGCTDRRLFSAIAAVFAVVAAAPLVYGQTPRAGRAVVNPKIHPRVLERAQKETVIPVFIVLAHQPQREILERTRSVNALYRQMAESRQAREEAEAVTLRTRRQAFQAIEQAIGPEQDALESRLLGVGAAHISRYQGINMLAAEIPASAIATLEADPSIAQLFPVEKLHPQLANSVPALGAPAFWNAGYTGQGESVGILDTGVRTNHPAFAGVSIVSQVFLTNASADPCFADNANSVQDQQGHGTHVAGIVASQGSTGWTNYQGVAKGIGTLYNLKVGYKLSTSSNCDPVGAEAQESDVLAALDWAVRNTSLKIFNLSFGSPPTGDDDGVVQAIDQYIDNYGLTIAFAAGNGGPGGYTVTTPGIAYNGITVANWTTRGSINDSSSRGATPGGRLKPDLAAPGTGIRSAAYDWDDQVGTAGDFVLKTGTSMAAPHIAGAAALLASAGVTDPLAIKAILINAADSSGSWANDAGWGYTNLDTALSQLNYMTGSLTPTGPQLYRLSSPGTVDATVVWNRHFYGGESYFNSVSLQLFREDTGDLLSSVNQFNNVQRVTSSGYTGNVVLSVSPASLPMVGVASEPFAVASNVRLTPAMGARITASCTVPASILSGSQFPMTCSATNSGDLTAVGLGLTNITSPPGWFNGGSLPWIGDVGPGSSSSAAVTLSAPDTVGTYTLHWTMGGSPSFGSMFAFTGSLTATVTGALPEPALVSPANGATGVSQVPTLRWSASPGAAGYDVYLGTAFPLHLVASVTQTSYIPDVLAPGSLYFWQVVARGAAGARSSAVWSLATQAATPGQQLYLIATAAGGPPSWGLTEANDVALDSAGNVYVAQGNGAVSKVAPDGTTTQFASGTGVTVDRIGNVYVASGFTVNKIAPDGSTSTVAGNGTPGYSGDGGPATSAQLVPNRLAVDAVGNLYISDTNSNTVRKVATNGVITTVAGNGTLGYSGDGGPATSAQLSYPYGMVMDAAGSLYISDAWNLRVRKVTPDGTISTFVAADYPRGLAIDAAGNFYIAESSRVRKVAPNGTVTTIAGTGGCCYSGDNGPALSADLAAYAVALGDSGKIYIPDGFSRVRVLVPWDPSCTYQVDQSAIVASSAAAVFPITVHTSPSCWWGVGQLPDWITAPGLQQGSGTVYVTVATNFYVFHSATISVAGAAVTISQADGVCSFALDSSSAVAPAVGGAGTIHVSACPDGFWSVSNAPWWMSINPTAGTGSATLSYTVSPNTGPARSATLTIGGLSFTIQQHAGSADGFRFVPVSPCRVADTRFGDAPTMAARETRSFPIPQSACGIPNTAQAYSLNVTVVPKKPLAYLTLWPTGQTQPGVSTLNSWDGIVVANAAMVPAGMDGAVSVYVTDPTDVILDINGYFDSPGSYAFYPVQPCRVADTRNADGPFGGPTLGSHDSRDFTLPSSGCGLPSSASAYSMNVTVVPDVPLGYLTTWPTGQPRPGVSTLNSWTGKVVANAAIVPAGANGSISVFVQDPTDVILDTNGYFGAPGNSGALNFYPVTPCRVADTRNPGGGGEMQAGESRSFAIPQSGCGIPANAAAYSMNVTVVPERMLQYLTAWPTDAQRPGVSTLNSWDGSVVANAAIIPAGTGGAISIYATDRTHVILDINGYFAP